MMKMCRTAAAAALVSVICCVSVTGSFAASWLSGDQVRVEIQGDSEKPFSPVSMTPVGDHKFIVANYQNLYLFDTASRSVARLKPVGNIPTWAPTGVYYSPIDARLFVANYVGNDVLIFRFDGRSRLTLEARLTDERAIEGPEGIQVSADGRLLALANEFGQNVALLERHGAQWAMRWKVSVDAAHGVSIVGSNVYASGTEIVEIDIASGAVSKRSRSIGAENIRFATCIEGDSQTGGVIVSDPEAGKIYFLDRELTLSSSVGSNGPGLQHLDMPYCSYRFDGDLFVLSTYQDRIISTAGHRGAISWLLGPDWHWLSAATDLSYDARPITLMGLSVTPGYGSLRESGDAVTLLMPARYGVMSTHWPSPKNNWPHYIISAAVEGDWTVVLSNSAPTAILFNRRTNAIGRADLGEWDCWGADDKIACPNELRHVSDVVAHALIVEPSSDLAAIATRFNASEGDLAKEFVTVAGKKFLDAYLQGNGETMTEAYAQYLSKIREGDQAVLIMEYWLASALGKSVTRR